MFSSSVLPCILACSLLCLFAHAKDSSSATEATKDSGIPSTVTVSTIKDSLFYEEKKDSDPIERKGYLIELMDKLKKKLNLTKYNVVSVNEAPSQEIREEDWTKVIQNVVDNKADLGLAIVTPNYVDSVEFSTPLVHFGYSVVRSSPRKFDQLQRSVFFCLTPYTSGVWACVLIVMLVTVALLTANAARNPRERAQRMSRGELGPTNSEEPLTVRDHLNGAFWFVLSTTALQSGTRQPMSVAGRVLALTWWLFAGLTLCTYIVALLMDLVASKGYQPTPFTTVQELMTSWVNDKGYRVFFQHDALRNKFKARHVPMFQFLYAHSHATKDDVTKGGKGSMAWVQAMLNESDRNLIVMGSEATIKLIESRSCGSVLVTEFLEDRYLGLAFRPDSSALRRAVNKALLEMAESGDARELIKKYGLRGGGKCGLGFYPKNPLRSIRQMLLTETVSEAVRGVAEMFYDSLPISMGYFAGILVFYIIGLIFALCGLALDIYMYTHPEGFKHNDQILTGPDPREEILDTPEFQNLNEA